MGKVEMFFENIQKIDLPKKRLLNFMDEMVKIENFSCGRINFIFCNDQYLLNINKEFLKHDYFTDIITFDYSKNKKLSGDLYLSVERITENAGKFGVSFLDEIVRVMIHGILHLIGYNDKTSDEKKMIREKEDIYLNKFNSGQ
jgi:probable rRNA maturation factor